jgi:hypothetical protein
MKAARVDIAPLFEHLRNAMALSTRNLDEYRALVRLANRAQRAIEKEHRDEKVAARALDEVTRRIESQFALVDSVKWEGPTHGPRTLLDHVLLASALIVDCLGIREHVQRAITAHRDRRCNSDTSKCSIKAPCEVCYEFTGGGCGSM